MTSSVGGWIPSRQPSHSPIHFNHIASPSLACVNLPPLPRQVGRQAGITLPLSTYPIRDPGPRTLTPHPHSFIRNPVTSSNPPIPRRGTQLIISISFQPIHPSRQSQPIRSDQTHRRKCRMQNAAHSQYPISFHPIDTYQVYPETYKKLSSPISSHHGQFRKRASPMDPPDSKISENIYLSNNQIHLIPSYTMRTDTIF